MLRISKDTL